MEKLAGLLDLPNELLAMIKDALDSLDPSDLLTNVSFYHLCLRTRACFHRTTRKEWKWMVRASGLGRHDGEYSAEVNWQDIALECAEHAWRCTHPGCGKAQIERNHYLMKKALKKWGKVGWGYSKTVGEKTRGRITPSSVFETISFNHLYSLCDDPEDIEIGEIAFLRDPVKDVGPTAWGPEDVLDRHPIAARSFATIPPVRSVDFVPFKDFWDVTVNRRGVTVQDVLTSIGTILNRPMLITELDEYLELVIGGSFYSIFPESWTPYHLVRTVRDIGDWFKLVNWVGMRDLEMSEGPRCLSLQFQGKPLPNSPFDHLVRY